ncbi:MAG: OadG family protein [Dehalococcoidales bacterium]|nr:OadG family protein [Dehalococcoidales bacterium]
MDWSFGLTMTLMGMGVTFITLLILVGVIRLLTRFYPYKKEEESGKEEK